MSVTHDPSAAPAPSPTASTPSDAEIAAVGEARRVSVARARLEALFDPGTFDEIGDRVLHRSTLFGIEKKQIPGDGVITGVGTVDGRTAMKVSSISL